MKAPTSPWMLTPDALRQRGAIPRYFGLGFIQVNLEGRRRLHFWVPDWPTIPGAESEFHDHRSAFVSQVLLGAVEHEMVALGVVHPTTGPRGWEVVSVSCRPGAEGQPVSQGYADILPMAAFRVEQGGRYRMFPDAFHRSRPVGPTITLVERGPEVKTHARVLRPPGSPFVCPFSLPLDEAACWERLSLLLDQDPPVWVDMEAGGEPFDPAFGTSPR